MRFRSFYALFKTFPRYLGNLFKKSSKILVCQFFSETWSEIESQIFENSSRPSFRTDIYRNYSLDALAQWSNGQDHILQRSDTPALWRETHLSGFSTKICRGATLLTMRRGNRTGLFPSSCLLHNGYRLTSGNSWLLTLFENLAIC